MTEPSPSGAGAPEPESLDVLRAALSASDTGTWHWDRATNSVDWDTTMEHLHGLEPGAFDSTFDGWLATLHPDDRDAVVEEVMRAVDAVMPYKVQHRVVWPDGSHRWLECRGQVTTDATGATGTVGYAIDITDQKVAELEREAHLEAARALTERLDRLQRIGGLLAGAVSVVEVGRAVVDELATPGTADARGLWVLDDAGSELELVASTGWDDELVAFMRTIPLTSDLPGAVAARERRVVQSPAPDDAVATFPSLAGVARTAPGFAVVPLLVEDTCEGIIAVGIGGPELPELDLRFLEASAGHIAQAVTRIRLSETVARWAQEASVAAERERRRREQVEFIAQISGAATAAADHRDLMSRVASEAVPRLGDWCVLHFSPDGASDPEVVIAHVDPDRVELAKRLQAQFPFDPDAATGVAATIRTGRAEVIERIDEEMIELSARDSGADPAELRHIVDTLQLTSGITVPLVTKRGVVGAMQFLTAESGRHYDADDVALAEATAGRVADALLAAWVNEQQVQVAESLQRALLPPDLPALPSLDLAARYWPAGAVNDVGGDFYDVFRIDDQRWAIAIGDVCGTGPDAAAVTAIARHTIRAAARHGYGHDAVVDWVNQAVRYSDRDLFCTLCYATLERRGDRWRFTATSSGHPLPIVRRGGVVTTLGEPGTLLGIFADVSNHVATAELGSGDAVVLYTDGVTDLPPPHGLDPDDVQALVAAVPHDGAAADLAEAIHASLLDRVPDASRHDDVAVLAMRIL